MTSSITASTSWSLHHLHGNANQGLTSAGKPLLRTPPSRSPGGRDEFRMVDLPSPSLHLSRRRLHHRQNDLTAKFSHGRGGLPGSVVPGPYRLPSHQSQFSQAMAPPSSETPLAWNPMPLFVGFRDLAIFVITAIGTYTIREFCFLAARAECHPPQGELPVSSTFIAARLQSLFAQNRLQAFLASTRSANASTARTESPAFPRRTDN